MGYYGRCAQCLDFLEHDTVLCDKCSAYESAYYSLFKKAPITKTEWCLDLIGIIKKRKNKNGQLMLNEKKALYYLWEYQKNRK